MKKLAVSRPSIGPQNLLRALAASVVFGALAFRSEGASGGPGVPTSKDLMIREVAGFLQLELVSDSTIYFALQHTPDLGTPWTNVMLGLGDKGLLVDYPLEDFGTSGFFRIRKFSLDSPEDQDDDGIDDVWELLYNLDPLDASDAHLPSTMPDAHGLTNDQYYRLQNNLPALAKAVSREVSVFNYGDRSIPAVGIISREVSVVNLGDTSIPAIGMISREVSVLNLGDTSIPAIGAVSREFSVLNLGDTAVPSLGTVSREVSVLNTAP